MLWMFYLYDLHCLLLSSVFLCYPVSFNVCRFPSLSSCCLLLTVSVFSVPYHPFALNCCLLPLSAIVRCFSPLFATVHCSPPLSQLSIAVIPCPFIVIAVHRFPLLPISACRRGGKQCYTILRSSSACSLTYLAFYALALSVHTKAHNIPR